MPLSFLLERFRRGAPGAASASASRSGSRARAPSASDVELLRTRARRRLIGMVVLVGAGVLGFPWLFETQPRPIAPDVRIVQAGQPAEADPRSAKGRVAPSRELQEPLEPQSRVASITPATDDAASTEPPVETPPAAQPAVAKPDTKSDTKPLTKPVVKPAAEKPAGKPEPKAESRYVVQFGAFADVKAAREARSKAERLGLKTYAQQVDTPQGKRIRVRLGPFADKAEADRALATLRKGGLNGNLLTL